jgi:hypothetical protein
MAFAGDVNVEQLVTAQLRGRAELRYPPARSRREEVIRELLRALSDETVGALAPALLRAFGRYFEAAEREQVLVLIAANDPQLAARIDVLGVR